MLKEFKEFAMRGNVIDLAVGVILGAAFGKIVSSLVADIITPLIGLLVGGVDFSGLSFTFGEAKLMYGNFIQTVIDFVIIAFSIFLFIKLFNKVYNREKKVEEAPPSLTKEEELLTEIRDLLKSNKL
ncbi:large conductance mechanosensitive channel protein MscL [Domibacillus enclensis]|uniref:Large-conductance mechanosensitive channel n=1 Tax=Domibacillus enclensis TaxID=1017273 RepID=A0A1N6NCA4_9BACI|nr:large conductance mechanosensitive channel protein MscL [Domibacillus enclensis]OXS80000.1 large-conductance mechanosensitive channel [Domibacillus enclensis]SIP89652.1 large conductance mechanosensitive channel [Domibacillus enclensis]